MEMDRLVFLISCMTVTVTRGKDFYGICLMGLAEDDICTASYNNRSGVYIKDTSSSLYTIKTGPPLNISSGQCFENIRVQPFRFSNNIASNVSIKLPGGNSTSYYLNSKDPGRRKYVHINCTHPCDVIILSLKATSVKLMCLQTAQSFLATNAVYSDAEISFNGSLQTAVLRSNQFVQIKGRYIVVFTSENDSYFRHRIRIQPFQDEAKTQTTKCVCQLHCDSAITVPLTAKMTATTTTPLTMMTSIPIIPPPTTTIATRPTTTTSLTTTTMSSTSTPRPTTPSTITTPSTSTTTPSTTTTTPSTTTTTPSTTTTTPSTTTTTPSTTTTTQSTTTTPSTTTTTPSTTTTTPFTTTTTPSTTTTTPSKTTTLSTTTTTPYTTTTTPSTTTTLASTTSTTPTATTPTASTTSTTTTTAPNTTKTPNGTSTPFTTAIMPASTTTQTFTRMSSTTITAPNTSTTSNKAPTPFITAIIPPSTIMTQVSTTAPTTTTSSAITTTSPTTISSPTISTKPTTDVGTPAFTQTSTNYNTTTGKYTSPSVSCMYTCTFTVDTHLSEAERSKILQQKIAAIKEQLAVNKTGLSSTKRRKTSAIDNRPVAVVIGFVGVAAMSVFAAFVILFDLPLIVRGITRTYSNIKSKYTPYRLV